MSATCYRGQRYCSQQCRVAVRRQQLRVAAQLYQQSASGRKPHRDQQRHYRKSQSGAGVTHQALATINCPSPRASTIFCQCEICGGGQLLDRSISGTSWVAATQAYPAQINLIPSTLAIQRDSVSPPSAPFPTFHAPVEPLSNGGVCALKIFNHR